MNSIKSSSIGVYFVNQNVPNRARCKICKRELNTLRIFNLQAHLKRAHKIEVRLKKSKNTAEADFIKPETIDDPAAPSSDPIVVHVALEANEHIFSDDIPPLIPLSNDTERARKSEVIFQDTLHGIPNDEDPLAARSSERHANNPTQKYVTKKRVYNRTKSAPISTMTEESQHSSNENNYDEAFRKRKQFTELENLQMQNYKLKLELWAMEQELKVKSSKYTKDIVGLQSSHS